MCSVNDEKHNNCLLKLTVLSVQIGRVYDLLYPSDVEEYDCSEFSGIGLEVGKPCQTQHQMSITH